MYSMLLEWGQEYYQFVKLMGSYFSFLAKRVTAEVTNGVTSAAAERALKASTKPLAEKALKS